MPCASTFYDGPEPGHDAKARQELNAVTRMLCSVLRVMEAKGELPDDPELRAWFAEHREHDRRQGRE